MALGVISLVLTAVVSIGFENSSAMGLLKISTMCMALFQDVVFLPPLHMAFSDGSASYAVRV